MWARRSQRLQIKMIKNSVFKYHLIYSHVDYSTIFYASKAIGNKKTAE